MIDEQSWRQVAGNPDLGELSSPTQEPVDFAVWQAADGTWQLWSCIRNTKETGVSRLLYRWEGRSLGDGNWTPRGVAMRGDPAVGEKSGGLQAPYVVRRDAEYLMFYGDWVNICLATSNNGKDFQRASIDGKGPQLFSEGEGNNARDPMLLEIDGIWHCYYSAMPDDRGAMFVRRSPKLDDWSNSQPAKVLYGGAPGRMWYQAECPHVVKHEGHYYLFRTSHYRGAPLTTVYRSTDPTNFGFDDDSKIVTTLAVAAPEIIHDNGRYWIAALNPNLDGIRIARMDFSAIGTDARPTR